ncbi:MAG: carboxynorspermidine decarboxylase [Erysipelotrichaceae bacterium]|nr:carboxynorspermidine decarboxylase [Erysipelotrichaceae bacterium]
MKTPCWIVDEAGLEENGRILKQVQDRTGCRILLAQKAFSNYDFYPLLSGYLAGTEASGLYEARLGFEQMPGKEVHVFCAAYREDEMVEVIAYADHIVFNSITQLKRYGPAVKAAGKSAGLRVNPEYSTQEGHAIYDPCAPGSRMGVTRQVWDEQMDDSTLALVDGLHFHTLCEQDAEDLQTTLQAVREKFGDILSSMKWLNMGGGHHITRPGYNISLLEDCIKKAAEDWQVQVYLEPGEAVALNAGFLASRILDVVENAGVRIGILDASAACHMPDVIEMPYTPPLLQSSPDNPYVFRLAGPTCLAGDVMGKYAFEASLKPGDLLLFGDMAIYTTCKTNTFNGMPLPQIYAFKKDGSFQKLTDFGYQDFKNRLGS